ncbi:hypothetical protein [Methylobacterium brachythecii]|uniref:Porin family protein n=1 Tax=Methylobacterium brachythecii TaxID=1176177 RepID=A0A7W6AKN9_9HYPH|nr:hypothetical protein [Methylobacterium brachythecii]MBB3905213.1 hypothetical protein [Methylobacterium brachythecii]
MSLLRICLGLSVLASPVGTLAAHAEDFSGFYAGVNAGYAFDRDVRKGSSTQAVPGPSTNADAAPGLPPSAETASQSSAMRGSRAASSPRR